MDGLEVAERFADYSGGGVMTLAQLRKLLPGVVVENHPYDIGYWLRWAGQDRPAQGEQRQEGWDDADTEIRAERTAFGSEIIGTYSRIEDRP